MKQTRTRGLVVRAAVFLALVGMAHGTQAQEAKYPSRPVTIVVSIGAGSGLDLASRLIGKKLEARLGQPFIIENKPGMAGGVAAASVARTAGDGYTLLTSFLSANVFNPIIYKKMPYNVDELRFVTMLYDTPFALIVPASSGIQNLQQLIERLRADPPSHTYASGGVGSAAHIAGAMFLRLVGAPGVVHVPFRTTPAIFPDLISNRVTFTISAPDSVLGFVKEGQLRALFVSGEKRLASWPDVPTAAEAGLPDMRASSWYIMQTPVATPKPIVDRLASEVSDILREPDVAAFFRQSESTPMSGYTPEKTAEFVEREKRTWEPHVRASGVVLE